MRDFTANDLLIHDITQTDSLGYEIHTPVDGLDYPAIRLSSYDKPGEHGALVTNQLYGGRQVDLTGMVFGPDILTYNQRRRDLQATFRIIRSNYISLPILCKFTNDDGLLLQFEAYLRDKMKMAEMYLYHGTWFVTLFAPDPNLYDQTLLTAAIDLSLSGGGSVFPVVFPFIFGAGGGASSHGEVTATNEGDANTFPIVTFNGPLTNPVLENTLLSETFKLNETIAGGDSVVVDMAKNTIVLNGTTSEMDKFDDSNTWISLVPGDNPFTLDTDASENGSVEIAFRSAYLGR